MAKRLTAKELRDALVRADDNAEIILRITGDGMARKTIISLKEPWIIITD